jgi:hypothetical protein
MAERRRFEDRDGPVQQAVAADRDTQSLARRKRVISLCGRGALDNAARGG